jgi:hypothetical protein
MTSPLLISVAVALLTTGAAALWAILVGSGMSWLPDSKITDRRDIRTW